MKSAIRIIPAMVAIALTLTAQAEEPEVSLEPAAEQGRWHFSAGARFAPGVKARSVIPSGAIVDVTGRLRGAGGSRRGPALPSGTSSTTTHRSSATTRTSSESVPVAANSRFDFDNGFVDMADTSEDPAQTWNWHFDSADAFDPATGGVTGSSKPRTTTSRKTPCSGPVTGWS